MNRLLERAFAEVSRLPDDAQEAIAAGMLEQAAAERQRGALRATLIERRAKVAAGHVVDGETALAALHDRLFPGKE